MQQLGDKQAEQLADHQAEPRSAWGARAEREFSVDLQAIGAQAGFQVLDVDCRSSTCAAEVQFPSDSDARANWMGPAPSRRARSAVIPRA